MGANPCHHSVLFLIRAPPGPQVHDVELLSPRPESERQLFLCLNSLTEVAREPFDTSISRNPSKRTTSTQKPDGDTAGLRVIHPAVDAADCG
ncbi:hypothetical protein EYF80_018740 [Liparis tanakae]|uniref:Uncharacterized protein n=1 Tax=Liparis tanakae TaxID=230148 RepID=A0A4Z2HYZ2_9TELE|nr:hypothetical protein EYF80_018740 [Liparis tanakae]